MRPQFRPLRRVPAGARRIIARIHPEAWDWIVPHGPLLAIGRKRAKLRGDPDPVPSVLGAAAARSLIDHAVTAQMFGLDLSRLIAEIDGWCGTVPLRPPWWWPVPPPPDPRPDWDQQMFGAAALVLTSAAATLDPGELQDTLAKGAELLYERADRAAA